jgi:transposase
MSAGGMSSRLLAELLGVSKSTVHRDKAHMASAATVEGRDSKTYPASADAHAERLLHAVELWDMHRPNREIAARLGVSERTVRRWHRQTYGGAFGTRDQSEAPVGRDESGGTVQFGTRDRDTRATGIV